MTPLLGFMPDADPTAPGVVTACSNFIPFSAGMRAAEGETTDAADIPADCLGALSVGSTVWAGTGAGLYSVLPLSAGSTDRSRGGGYALNAGDYWSFAEFRDAIFAATPTAVLQRSTGGAFANVSGSPQAKIIEASSGFIVAFNTTTSDEEWYCSAIFDPTNWTLSVSNQCVSGRLDGAIGPITAAKRFGDGIVAFKETSMFVGRYVGVPAVWQWTRVSELIGCVGQNAVVETPLGLVFVGREDVYLYDGTAPRPIGAAVREWLFSDMDSSFRGHSYMVWDEPRGLVWLGYLRTGGGAIRLNGRVAWHVATNRWGVAHTTSTAMFKLTTVATGEVAWFGYNTSPVDLKYYSGAAAAGSITTGDYGNDSGYMMCRNLRVRYTQAPASSSVTGYTKDSADASLTTGATVSVSDGQHHLRQTARWHRFKIDTGATGTPCEIVGIDPEFVQAGRR